MTRTCLPLRASIALALAGALVVPASLEARQGLPPVADRVVPGVVVHVAAPGQGSVDARLSTLPGPRVLPVYAWTTDEAIGADEPEAAVPQNRVGAGSNVAMMAVGGAALVTGLIIGGDGGLIIATGGGVIGLVGLYRYLR